MGEKCDDKQRRRRRRKMLNLMPWNFPNDEESMRRFIASNLPPPLDLPILAKLDTTTTNKGGKKDGTTTMTSSKLNIADIVSGLGLLGAWADFEQESRQSWMNYDNQTARLLFEKAGITNALHDELVAPLLSVLPMCPSYDCSAAAALSCFHAFALQSRGAFDVRWCRGSISELIFDPWREQLESRGVTFATGARVESIENIVDDGGGGGRRYSLRLAPSSSPDAPSAGGVRNAGDIIECDAIVLAVGATSAGKLTSTSSALSSIRATENFHKLRGITCVAVRLFLRSHPVITRNLRGGMHDGTTLPPCMARAMMDSPITVCGPGVGGFRELNETGFCIYDLGRMHDEFSVDRYDAEGAEDIDRMAVLEVDFYRADSFVDWDDGPIVDLALRAVSAALGTEKINADYTLLDSAVVRARNAVSHFCPNSALHSPDVKLEDGLYVCGDWVDRTGHASWSTEKSVVTARQAASALSRDFCLRDSRCGVIPAARDTAQLSALRRWARMLRKVLPPKTVPPSPWVLARQILSGERDL